MSAHTLIDREFYADVLATLFSDEECKSSPDVSWVLPLVRDALFEEVLIDSRGNQFKAAQRLGVNRGTLRTHIRRIRKEKSQQ